jgi:hypothetical protein
VKDEELVAGKTKLQFSQMLTKAKFDCETDNVIVFKIFPPLPIENFIFISVSRLEYIHNKSRVAE